jgi:small subunit ribosomal protein S11
VTDRKGNKITQSSAGACGFRGSRKSTPYAAQIAAETAGNKAKDLGMAFIKIELKGPGPGRESAIRALVALGFKVSEIVDATPIPHNGVRPKKRRRV